MRNNKPLPTYQVNGWEIDRRPNTFCERFAYHATAVDADGFQTARHGFSTLAAARAFCEANEAPHSR